MTDNRTNYKRGQVESALWQLFAANRPSPRRPPQAFLTRMKRLWEIDRQMGAKAPGFAFFDEPPVGRGYEVGFSPFNCFSLAIGMDLLDAGYKQAEVVTLLRHIRPRLAERFAEIQKNPPAPFDHRPAKVRPGCPTYQVDGDSYADCRVYMLLEKVELTEVHLLGRRKKGKAQAIQIEPVFCAGIAALTEEFHTLSGDRRKLLVVEIAEMAELLGQFLEQAPVTKRGRK